MRGDGTNTYRPAGYVQLNPIPAGNYKNLKMVVAFGDPRGASCGGCPRNSVGPTDRIRLQYSFDGGPFVTAGFLRGNAASNGYWQQDTSSPLDSIPEGTVLNQDYKDITANISGTGTTLRVRVVCDSRAPELAFDNIRVMGDLDNSPKPTLGALEPAPASYTEGGSAIAVTGALTVGYSDGSATTLTGAKVSISSNFVNGEDRLNFATQGTITGTFGTNGVLTLSGNASQAAYQGALRTITYSNTNTTTLATGTRQVTFQVYNGAVLSNTPVRTINITGVLNAPAALNYTENFDVDGEGTRYFGNAFANLGGSETGFFRATNSPATFNGARIGTATFTGWSGGYWFGEGTESTLNPTNPYGTVQLAPVDASGRNNLQFTIAIGSGGNWLGYLDAFNPGDSFELFYRTNGGTPVKFGAFYGVTGAAPARQDGDLDPLTPANGTQLGPALQDFTFTLPAAAAVGNLDFMLRLRSRGTSEIAFDNIRITGVVPATVTTISLGAISNTSATVGGEVTDAGGGTVTERGVVYSATNLTPTIGGTGVTRDANGAGLGQFGRVITGLLPNTTYYVRAYATNAAGAAYGAVETFSTPTFVVSINRDNPNPTNLATVSYTVTFGNNVTGGTTSNFSLTTSGLAGAAVASVAGTGATRTVLVNTGTGSGSLTLNMANANGLYPNFSNPFPFAGQPYTVDKTAPTVSGVAVPANATYGAGQTLNFTVTFSTAVTVTTTGGTPGLGLTVGSTARTAGYVSGSGTAALVFRYPVVAGDLDPNGVVLASALALNGGAIQDAAAKNAALALSGVPATAGVLVDGVAPTVTAFTGPAATGSSTGTNPFAFSVSFSESVSDFLAGDIAVTNGTVSSGPTGSGAGPYSFSVTPTTPGTVTTVAIAAGAAKDAAGNASTASATYSLTFIPPTATVTGISKLAPTAAQSAGGTAMAQVSFTVTFSAPVSGVNASNFSLNPAPSGAGIASVSPATGASATYTVVVNTGTGNGTLQLNVASAAGLTPSVTNTPFSGTSAAYTIVKNFAAAPLLSLRGAGSASGNNDVTAFVDLVQVVPSGTGTAVANAVQNSSFETNNVSAGSFLYANNVVAAPWTFGGGSGVSRNGTGGFASTAPTGGGDAVGLLQNAGASLAQNLAVPTGTYQVNFQTKQRNYTSRDQVLNVFVVEGSNDVFIGTVHPASATAYQAFTSAVFNVTAPALTATVSTTSGSPTSATAIPFLVNFTQPVGSTFDILDVTVTGGTRNTASFSGSGAGPYTFTVTPTGTGNVSVSLAANVATDANNTGNTASNAVSVQYQLLSLSSVSPAAELPGQVVTLTGVGFTSASTASFGTTAASVTLVSATTLTATVPAGLAPGSAPVSVSTSGGTTAAQPFTVLAVYDGGTLGNCAAAVPATTSVGDGAWHYLLSPTGQVVAAYRYTGASLGALALDVLRADPAQPVRQDPRQHYYLDRNWHLTASGGRFDGRTVGLRLYGLNSEQARLKVADPTTATLANLKATQYSGPNEDCDLANNVATAEHRTLSAPASSPVGTAYFVAELAVADHFSEFYLTGSPTPLPVELTTFTATAVGNRAVRLDWATASEKKQRFV